MDKRILISMSAMIFLSLVILLSVKIFSNSKGNTGFSYSPISPVMGMNVEFNDTSSFSDITKWKWDFDDDEFSFEKAPKHIFASATPHRVVLTIYHGNTYDTVARTLTIKEEVPMVSAPKPNTIAAAPLPQPKQEEKPKIINKDNSHPTKKHKKENVHPGFNFHDEVIEEKKDK